MSLQLTAGEIAKLIDGQVQGSAEVVISGLAAADTAQAGDLTFADKSLQFNAAESGAATAILATPDCVSGSKTVIHVRHPRIAFSKLLPLFHPPEEYSAGIYLGTFVPASASIDSTAHIGPGCSIGEGVKIGARSVLIGGNYVARGAQIGAGVTLYPHVIVYQNSVIGDRTVIHAGTVIGADGYGYVFDAGHHRKVLQVGNVVIHEDVEIGANCTIDRGALGPTVIGAGTKIDNLVHIAHNVTIGRHCLIMGQVGFAGSTELGDYGVIASQSGIAGHLKLGDRSTVGAKSGVMRDVPAGGTVLGLPAAPDQQAKRQWVGVQQLPELVRRVRSIERLLAGLLERNPAPPET